MTSVLAQIAAWFEARWRGAADGADPAPMIKEAKRIWPDASPEVHMYAAATAALIIELDAEEMISEARASTADSLRRGRA